MKTRKAISPVIATALLIVVSVVAVVGFQNWYSSYSSTLGVNVEQKSSASSGRVDIEYISSGGIIYITNRGNSNVSINTIKIGENDCAISQDLKPGANPINIGSCLGSDEISNVVIVTDSGIIEEKIFTGDVSLVIVLSTSLSCNTDSDSDSYISFSCASYPMTNTTFEGHLDTNDNNATIIADTTCWLKSDKSSCVNNFIINGCGVGTVQDIGTGLCWQRNMSSSGTLNWANAQTYCETTLDGLGGHNDWELPTKEELSSIIDLSRSNPAIVGGNNNKFTDAASNWYYWTDSTYYPNTASAWRFYFSNGNDDDSSKVFGANVVCVVR